METSQGRSENSRRSFWTGRHWTLMFIGDHGKVITLKHFKGLVVTGFIIAMAAVAVAVGLYLFNRSITKENKQLESSVKNLKKKLGTLRHDNEILMARLVLTESRVPGKQAAVPNEQDDAIFAGSIEKKTVGQPAVKAPVEEKNRAAVRQQGNKPAQVAVSGPQLRVAIENFKVLPVTGSRNLHVQFKLKNTSANSQRVSGHAIVILKGEQVEQSRWLSIPRIPLVDGKPTGSHRGYPFGINYFRTMKFTARTPSFPERYKTASVYVYTRAGKLLLEQDFAVNLPPSPADRKAGGPASPDALLKVRKNTEQ